jgi:hypothetical protein
MKNTFHYSTTVSGTGGIEHLTLGGRDYPISRIHIGQLGSPMMEKRDFNDGNT